MLKSLSYLQFVQIAFQTRLHGTSIAEIAEAYARVAQEQQKESHHVAIEDDGIRPPSDDELEPDLPPPEE